MQCSWWNWKGTYILSSCESPYAHGWQDTRQNGSIQDEWQWFPHSNENPHDQITKVLHQDLLYFRICVGPLNILKKHFHMSMDAT